MKGSLVRDGVCLLLGSVLTLAAVCTFRSGVPNAVAQGGGGDVPIGNGDVNADGEIDLSDAIYLLDSLFSGGPDAVPIESQPCDSCCPPPRLPATGQTLCYNNPGSEISCDSADYPGQDGFYQTGCPMEGRFVDNGDGTVTDTCTGLMWQKGTADVNGDGQISFEEGSPDRLNWREALQYCENLDFAGRDDWRLPNVRELQSIQDYGRFMPAIDPVFEAESDWYWSSTSSSIGPGAAFLVGFEGAFLSPSPKYPYEYFVRAVRGGL